MQKCVSLAGMGSVAWDIGSEALQTWRLLALGLNVGALWLLGGGQTSVLLDTANAVIIGIPQDAVHSLMVLLWRAYSAVCGAVGATVSHGATEGTPHTLLYIAAVSTAMVCLFRVARVFAAAYVFRWASVQHAFVGSSALRALCASAARPALPGSSRWSILCRRKPSTLTVGWDEGLVWRRGHFVWSEKGDTPTSAPVRLFSLAWLAGEKVSSTEHKDEADAQESISKAALSSMDDSAYTAWLATLRAAAGWQAEHLSLDVVMSSMGSKLRHQVISREFVAKWPHWQRVARAGSAQQPSIVGDWAVQHTQQCLQQDAAAQHRLVRYATPATWSNALRSVGGSCLRALLRGDLARVAWHLIGQPLLSLASAAGAAPALEAADTFRAASWALHRTGQLHQLQSWTAHVARMRLGWAAKAQSAVGRSVLWLALARPLCQTLQTGSRFLVLTRGSRVLGYFAALVSRFGVVRACLMAALACSLLVHLADAALEYWTRMYASICTRRTQPTAPSSPRVSFAAACAAWVWWGAARATLALGRTAALLVLPLLGSFAAEVVQLSILPIVLCCVACSAVLVSLGWGLQRASSTQRLCVTAAVGIASCILGALAPKSSALISVAVFFLVTGALLCTVALDAAVSAATAAEPVQTPSWAIRGPVVNRIFAAVYSFATLVATAGGPLQPVLLDAAFVCAAAAAAAAWAAHTPGTVESTETPDWTQTLSKWCFDLLASVQGRVSS